MTNGKRITAFINSYYGVLSDKDHFDTMIISVIWIIIKKAIEFLGSRFTYSHVGNSRRADRAF